MSIKTIQTIISLLLLICCFSAKSQQVVNTSDSIGKPSNKYQTVTFNGVWSWFSDPRAVYFEGKFKRTYAGWIDNYGDVHIGYYDHESGKIQSFVLYDDLEIDDHDNPTILFDDSGKLLVFFNTHLQDERPLLMRKSKNPEDISAWEPLKELHLNDEETYRTARILRHTYTNPVRLAEENGKIFLFWRGVNLKPSFATSADNGENWSKGKIFFQPEETHELKTPYTKIYSNGSSKIHIVCTDGHPTKEVANGLYYMYYENDAFYKADGTKIKAVSELPIKPSEMDVVFQSETMKSWNWDIAEDKKGNPVIAYAKFPKKNIHIYAYATFHQGEWKSYDLIDSGGWFPETPENKDEPEPHYSGGMTIDKENTNIVYVSIKRNNIFEIEQWTTNNHGKSWKIIPITKNSTKNNVRPAAVRNASQENPLQLLWLQNSKYVYYAYETHGKTKPFPFEERFHTAVKMSLPKKEIHSEATQANILHLLRTMADNQLENSYIKNFKNSLDEGLFFAGMDAFYNISNETRYKNEMYNSLQFEREESDEDEDTIPITQVIWGSNTKNNRQYLQRLESFKASDLDNLPLDFAASSLAFIMEQYLAQLPDLKEIEKNYRKTTKTIFQEIYSKNYTKRNLQSKALLIYSMAFATNYGYADEKYRSDVINAWKELQQELANMPSFEKLEAATVGSVLLAGKEIYILLDD